MGTCGVAAGGFGDFWGAWVGFFCGVPKADGLADFFPAALVSVAAAFAGNGEGGAFAPLVAPFVAVDAVLRLFLLLGMVPLGDPGNLNAVWYVGESYRRLDLIDRVTAR